MEKYVLNIIFGFMGKLLTQAICYVVLQFKDFASNRYNYEHTTIETSIDIGVLRLRRFTERGFDKRKHRKRAKHAVALRDSVFRE